MSCQGWIEGAGASLRYKLSGRPAAPLVMLIHEMGGSLESFDELSRLLEFHYRVLRFDIRGSGMSELGPGSYELSDLVDDIVCMLNGLDIQAPMRVLGVAVGGAIAIAFAARCPQRVSHLVLCSPAVGVPVERQASSAERARTLETIGIRRDIDIGLEKAFPNHLRHGREAEFASLRQRRLGANRHGVAALTRLLAKLDLRIFMQSIHVPTLVLAGQHDGVRSVATVREVADAITGSSFECVNAGHFMHIEDPVMLADKLVSFADTGRKAVQCQPDRVQRYQLFWSSRSPFVRKVTVFAHEVGVADQISLVSKTASSKSPDMSIMATSPANRIPALLCPDGAAVLDSHFICEYLDSLHGGPALFPTGFARRDALQRSSIANALMDNLVAWLRELSRTEDVASTALRNAYLTKLRSCLSALEELYRDANFSDRFDIGDISVAVALSYIDFRFSHTSWRSEHLGLATWLDAVSKRPSMRATEFSA